MINLNQGLPAYTIREIRNFGLFKAGVLYKYLFTREDNLLLDSGAIKLLPFNMCDFYISHDTVLAGKEYKKDEKINAEEFEQYIKTFVKTNVVRCEIKPELVNKGEEEIVKLAKLYNCVGLTFSKLSEELGIDYEIIKDKFELKQGGKQKKVTPQDIDKLKTIQVGE